MLRATKSVKFFRMAVSAFFFAMLALLFNAYVRYADAGVRCPDWPGCYGKVFAPETPKEHTAAQEAQVLDEAVIKPPPSRKAWREVVQRYIGGALGLILIRLAWLGWQLKKRKRNQQWIIPLATTLFVFGMVVVSLATIDMQFKPLVMQIQLLGNVVTVALLWWIVLREHRFWRPMARSNLVGGIQPRALVTLGLAALTAVLGGWSMVNHAAFACPDFPTCQGSYWPSMDVFEGLVMWREAGLEFDARSLNLPGATAIHFAHRVSALVTLLYAGWLSFYVLHTGIEGKFCRYGFLVLLVLSSAVALGVMQVLMHMPLVVAVAHSAAGALLVLSLVTLYHVVRPLRLA